MRGDVLTVNIGSSSLKLSLWDEAFGEVLRGEVDGIGAAPRLTIAGGGGHDWGAAGAELAAEDLLADVFDLLAAQRGGAGHLGAIGHRIVHGGLSFAGPVRIDDAALAAIEALAPLAPLHQPHGIAGIAACRRLRPGLPQVAAFDTSFHATLPPEAFRMAIPRDLEAEGLRRYGFHGLSFASVARHLDAAEPTLRRVIVAHLGSGSSLCALKDGRSVDTTMGLTPLDGLVMATRPGLLDPGLVPILMRRHGLDAEAIEDLFYHRCGLLGVSGGLSGDMRELLASDDPRAGDAVALFVHRAAREIGALAASLQGIDGLVFTGGIGEHSAAVRTQIANLSAWLGIALDVAANAAGASGRISSEASRVAVLVIPADEEREIAAAVRTVLDGAAPEPR